MEIRNPNDPPAPAAVAIAAWQRRLNGFGGQVKPEIIKKSECLPAVALRAEAGRNPKECQMTKIKINR